jgi:hypothetical protein
MANGIEAGTTNFATVAACCTHVRINIGAVKGTCVIWSQTILRDKPLFYLLTGFCFIRIEHHFNGIESKDDPDHF